MPGRRAILLTILSICTSQAVALPVHVTLDWQGNALGSTHPSVSIKAVQAAGPNAGDAPVEAEAESNSAVLNLSDGIWQLQASAAGYWSQEAEVVVAHQAPASVRLRFWPAASLHGVVVTEGGETPPDSLEVHLNATTASAVESTPQASITRTEPGLSRAELHCRIDAGMWSCLGPAGLFDMRLEAAGYVPRYEWGVSLKAAQTVDFGKTELLKTASVSGQVIRQDGSNPPTPCRATLWPDMERRGPADPEQEPESGPDAKTSHSGAFNPRGYFQVVGVVPGRYSLAVACQGASAFKNLRVQANTETRIDPLVLEDLTLDISVMPKTDPAGQPWKLAVYETSPHHLRIANAATTSADGLWKRHGLMAGNYQVVVSGSDGTAWLQKYFDFGKNSGPLSLRMGSVGVAGRVMMSSQPVRARMIFTNNVGGAAATLTSDDNGRFQGLLPAASSVQASSWTVEAHVVQPPLTQQLLGVIVRPAAGGATTWLDLELPAVPVRGSVVSPDGKPQPNVEVIFERSGTNRTTTSTDDAGRFEMRDLPLGKYTAMADSYDGTSDRMPFEVGQGSSSSELKLVLHPFKRWSFNVVSSQGPVPDAAVQVWTAPGVPRAFVHTDENGRFEVSLAPGTTEVGLTIGAPGFAIKLTRLPVSSESSDDPPDAHTITLDTTSGTLVLNFQPPGRPVDDSVALYLVHNGAIQDARTIAGWGTDQAGANINGPVTVDMIEPGDYALCRADPAEVSVLWTGPPPPDRCRKGSLEEDQTLTLSPQ
jgi:hypothetical protein